MASNRVEVTIEVDGDRARTKLANVNRHVIEFTKNTNDAGRSGSDLKTIFAGSVLADFFTRGSSAAAAFAAKAIEASAAGADANRVLSSSATEAGIGYTELGIKAEDFGRRVGLSNTEAARTFAGLTQFANQAGQTDKLDLFTRKLADLAAARGIASNQLGDLAKQLGTLQDEATDKLFGANPSAFYGAFAASIGKTADALTDAEKRAAIFNAVIERGGVFDGSAEERLAGTAGQLDSAKAGFDNLITGIGDAITTSVEFQGALSLVDSLLGNVATSAARTRAELAKGLKTPEQIADEERSNRGVANFLKGAASFVPAIGFQIGAVADYARGKISADELSTETEGIANAIYNPGQVERDARVDQLRADKAQLDKQQKQAEERAEIKKTDAVKEQAHARELERTKKEKEALKDKYEAQRQAIKDVQSESDRLLGSLASRAARDNPYISFFTEASDAARDFERVAASLEKQFGASAAGAIDMFAALNDARIDGAREDLLGQRLADGLKANALRREAAGLKNGEGVTDADERDKSFLAYGKANLKEQELFDATYKRLARQGRARDDIRPSDFLGLVSPLAATKSDDPAAKSAREDIAFVNKFRDDLVKDGFDKDKAQQIADKQLSEITGRVGSDVLAKDSGLRDTRIDVLTRDAERTQEREEKARARQEAEDKSRADLKQSLDSLTEANAKLRLALDAYEKKELTIKVEDRSSATVDASQLGNPTR